MNTHEAFGLLFAEIYTKKAGGVTVRFSGVHTPDGEILYGAGLSGDRHLLVPAPVDHQVTPSYGHSLTLDLTRYPLAGVVTRYLDLCCTDDSLGRVFAALTDSLLERISKSPGQAALEVEKALTEWRALFAAGGALSEDSARGLFGELLVLERLALENPVAAVESWSGPDKALHDFQTAKGHVEVKSSHQSNLEIVVSDIAQLDPTDLPALILIRLHIDTSSDGSAISDQLATLFTLGCPQQPLLTKAAAAGYVLGISPQDHRFRPVTELHRAWLVTDDFPSLRLGDIPQRATDAVTKVKYTLALQGAPGGLKPEELDPLLRGLIQG